MTDDNGRQAAAIKVSISNYVGTATLAVMVGSVALYTYIQQNFRPSWVFYTLIAVSVLLLVLSFIFGGWGSNYTAGEVAKDSWTKDTRSAAFNTQAILTLAGLVFVLAAAGLGATEMRVPTNDPCAKLVAAQLKEGHADRAQLLAELNGCEAIGS